MTVLQRKKKNLSPYLTFRYFLLLFQSNLTLLCLAALSDMQIRVVGSTFAIHGRFEFINTFYLTSGEISLRNLDAFHKYIFFGSLY